MQSPLIHTCPPAAFSQPITFASLLSQQHHPLLHLSLSLSGTELDELASPQRTGYTKKRVLFFIHLHHILDLKLLLQLILLSSHLTDCTDTNKTVAMNLVWKHLSYHGLDLKHFW